MDSWELTDFNIDGHIVVGDSFGIIKLMRAEDGTLTLLGNGDYGVIDQENPTAMSFVRPDSVLGFVLDIGIQRKKRLTYGDFYAGTPLMSPQSSDTISQKNFDIGMFENIAKRIERNYQSEDKVRMKEAIKTQFLFSEYNNARLLFPNFFGDSYLGLMRIIDALSNSKRASRYDFATFAACISPAFNKDIYDRLKKIGSYTERLAGGLKLFEEKFAYVKKNGWECSKAMGGLDEAGKFVYACFYSAYEYRSKFVHQGFPFPDSVKDRYRPDLESGMSYLSPTLGMSWLKTYRPKTGAKDDDLIDIHDIVGDEAEVFQKTYFVLLPTWHFLKELTRIAISAKVDSLV